MTRCKEFYEKLEKDGNFCGMSEQAYREAVEYSKEVEEDKNGKPLLSEGAWLKERREQAASHKFVEAEKPKPKIFLSVVDIQSLTEKYVRKMYREGLSEKAIREWVVKTLMNERLGTDEEKKIRKERADWMDRKRTVFTPEEIEKEEKLWEEQAKMVVR